eukprot:6445491-Prymnesium_polylepis.1
MPAMGYPNEMGRDVDIMGIQRGAHVRGDGLDHEPTSAGARRRRLFTECARAWHGRRWTARTCARATCSAFPAASSRTAPRSLAGTTRAPSTALGAASATRRTSCSRTFPRRPSC